MIKKVIAFSLWGEDSRYVDGAFANADLAAEIYPDWECRFYVDKSIPIEFTIEMNKRLNTVVELMEFDDEPRTRNWGWCRTMWRFLAAETSDVFISRDTDSRLSYREKAAVDEWLASDKDFHIMRDHPYHAVPILAGMWGCRNGIADGMVEKIFEFAAAHKHNEEKQSDQIFLAEQIYDSVKNNSMVHDPFFEKKEFPWGVRNPQFFVGQAYAGDGKILDDAGYFQDYFKLEKEEYAKSIR